MARGRRQFGSIRRLPSGRWQARYFLPEGRRVTAPGSFASKGDASRWLAAAEAAQARGGLLDPDAGRVRLAAFAEDWLQGKTGIGLRTREIYAVQLRLHILPRIADGVPPLGELRLADLTPELVRAWYAALVANRGRSTAARAYTRLRQILAQAVDDERLARNPCRLRGGGVEHHPEQRFVSLAQLYQLGDAVPSRYRALVLAAGLTGLRQGELFALRRDDLDLQAATVVVRRKRLRLASGEIIEDRPKSEAGRPTVALPAPLVEEMREHLARFTGPGRGAYVFTSPQGRPLERNNFRMRVWTPATVATGLVGLRWHDLRHTAGTLAARTGATTKEIMARLGHSSPRAAMVYQHAPPRGTGS